MMTDVTIPAPAAVTPEPTTTTPAAPAVTATPASSAEPAATPEAATAPGTETEQHPAAEDGSQEKQPTEAELKRKERNRERWRQMKTERDNSLRREHIYLAEIERLKKQAPDYSKITDPDDLLAEKTAARVRADQIDDNTARFQNERQIREQANGQIWDAIKEEMTARIPDFEQKVMSVPISHQVADFIFESEKGGDVAYYLGSHPDVARNLDHLCKTAPRLAERELGRIEARLSAPAAKTTSTAPKPAQTLNGGANPLGFDAKRASVSDTAAQLRKAGIIR